MPSPAPALPDKGRTVELPAGTPVVRVHRTAHGPIFFGPPPGNLPANRFDAPGGEFGTLYAAEHLAGGLVETVLRRGRRIVAQSFLDQRAWSVLRLRRPCRLGMLHGEGLSVHGVTADICAGNDYGPPQALALAFYERYDLDGLVYRARHNNDEICYAFNDRLGRQEMELVETSRFSDHPDVIEDLLRRHGAVIDPNVPVPPLSRST